MASRSRLIDWPDTAKPSFVSWALGFLLILVAAPLLGETLLVVWPSVFRENGLIETPQMALLGISAILFAHALVRSSGARAVFSAVLILACLLALQREIPACESAFYEGGICATRPAKAVFAVGAGTICALVLLLKHAPWRRVVDLGNILWVWPVALAAVLLGLAELAEHRILVEIEETLELGAYLYLALFATGMAFRSPDVAIRDVRSVRRVAAAPRSRDANKPGTLPETTG
jgi:hypothetical protein